MRLGAFGRHRDVGECSRFVGERQTFRTLLDNQPRGLGQPRRHRAALIEKISFGGCVERVGVDDRVVEQTARQIATRGAAPAFVANGISYEPKLSGISIAGDIVTIPYSATAVSDYTVVAQVQLLSLAKCNLTSRTTRTPPIVPGDPFVALPPPEDNAWQHRMIPLAAELFDPTTFSSNRLDDRRLPMVVTGRQ